MKRRDVLEALDSIYEMKDEEIAMNVEYIRKVSIHALSLIKNKYPKKPSQPKKKPKRGEGITEEMTLYCVIRKGENL